MTATKRILATLVGFVTYFLLGWLIFGLLLMDFYADQTTEAAKAVWRPEGEMIWWALLVSNLFMAYLLVYIFSKWESVRTFSSGLMAGMTIAIIIGIAIDAMFYASYDMMGLTGYAVDIIANAVLVGLTGGVIAWFLGRK